jgi:predicted lipid-binding transport protein (Tim44 family)
VTLSKSGEILDGDRKSIREVTDIWTFSRDLTSRDPNWALVATEAA